MSDLSEEQREVQIGRLYGELNGVREAVSRIGGKTTEIFEKQLAGEVEQLVETVADVLYLVSEHLTCHDCDDEEEGGEG